MNNTARLNYTNIIHSVRLELGLDMNEYAVADAIYHLSNNPKSDYVGWCYASKTRLGSDLGLCERTVHTIIQNLLTKGLIEKHNETKHLRTTSLWYSKVIVKDTAETAPTLQQVQEDSNSFTPKAAETAVDTLQKLQSINIYNNNKDNKNKEIYKEKENSVNQTLKQKKSKSKYPALESLTEVEFTAISKQYSVPVSFVMGKYDDLINHCESKNVTYSGYLGALRTFVKRDKNFELAKRSYLSQARDLPAVRDIDTLSPEEKAKANAKLDEIRGNLVNKLSLKPRPTSTISSFK